MAFSIVGTAVKADTAGAAVDTYTLPTGIQAGDGAILFLGYASGAITQTLDQSQLSTPFTQVAPIATFSGHQSQLWSVQNLAASDSGKVITATQSAGVRVAGVLVVYRGASKTAMVNAFASKTSAVGSTSPSTPTVTTTVAGCAEVGFICSTRGATTPQITAYTPPTGTTISGSSFDPAAGGAVTTAAVAAVAGHNLTAAASGATIGGDTYTVDQSAVYSAWTVALAPAATGPTSVDAGSQQIVTSGSVVNVQGSESLAAGTTLQSRAWSAITYPGTTAPTITNPTAAAASFTATLPGKYVLQYRVTDSTGQFKDATVTVWATTANARPNGTASAGIFTAVGAATLHAATADESDTTYAQAVNPSGSSFILNLDPAPVGGKTISYRLQLDPTTPGTTTYLVEYLNGGNAAVIASKNETTSTSGILAGSFILTDTQAANVTNPLEHQLRFTATAV